MNFSKSQLAAIKRFKAQETGAQTIFLRDKQVKLLCASWCFITRQITPSKKAAPKDDNECWRWLWEAVKLNFQELACTTGGRDRVLSALAIARANHLIYPDGSVNHFVLQILEPELDEAESSSRIVRSPQKDLQGQILLELKKTKKTKKKKKPKTQPKGPDKDLSLSIIKPLL